MPDYIYLLENRLSADQQSALRHLRDAARDAEMILFLTGDAVRDLTSGHAVRDLEVAVQGNALKLKKPLEKLGAKVWGEDDSARTLYLCFPGTVCVDLVSTHSVEYKKPGQATYHWASIQEDLRRRDFTVNAMAISLNDGSYGLLMDPLNGVADIETRSLRLVSNYGFLDEPALLIRAVRYKTRLGWELDPRTQTRYENAKEEAVMDSLSPRERSRELEQIGHEDDGLKVLRALEDEGWMKVLYPQWTHAKADVDKLHALHDLSVELLMQGVRADVSAAQMQLLTAKMAPKDLSSLKKLLLRPGFVAEWDSLDSLAAGYQKVLMAKENQQPSAAYKLFTTYDPEAVLWLGFTAKDKAVKERYHEFLKVWPEMRQKVPYAQMVEMRIRPELPNYNEIVHQVFLQLIDGKLQTPEEMKAFLEPYSPPAPPPQVTIKRARGRRAEPRVKETFEEDEESEESEDEMEDLGGEDEDEIGLALPKVDIEPEEGDEEAADEGDASDEDEDEEVPKAKLGGKAAKVSSPAKKAAEEPVKPTAKPAGPPKTPEQEQKVAAKLPAKAVTPQPKHAHPATKPAHATVKHVRVKAAPVKHVAPKSKSVAPLKKAAAKPAPKGPVKKAALKPHAKPAHKAIAKSKPSHSAKTKPSPRSAKPAPKPKPHAKAAHKPAPKKTGKNGKKR